MNNLDLGTKIGIGGILAGILTALIAVTGCVMNTNRLIKEGYKQENITYCSSIYTKTIWVK